MSYDIRFAVKVDGTDYFAVIGQPEYNSPTYNLREMFVACMGWNYKQDEWYSLKEVFPKIQRGIRELTFNPKAYEKYNDPNGWGTVNSALTALQSVEKWLTANCEGLHGSWNADIPLEHLYFSW